MFIYFADVLFGISVEQNATLATPFIKTSSEHYYKIKIKIKKKSILSAYIKTIDKNQNRIQLF